MQIGRQGPPQRGVQSGRGASPSGGRRCRGRCVSKGAKVKDIRLLDVTQLVRSASRDPRGGRGVMEMTKLIERNTTIPNEEVPRCSPPREDPNQAPPSSVMPRHQGASRGRDATRTTRPLGKGSSSVGPIPAAPARPGARSNKKKSTFDPSTRKRDHQRLCKGFLGTGQKNVHAEIPDPPGRLRPLRRTRSKKPDPGKSRVRHGRERARAKLRGGSSTREESSAETARIPDRALAQEGPHADKG